MVVPNQDGVPDCRGFNITGTLSTRSPGEMPPEVLCAHAMFHVGVLDGLKERLAKQEEESAAILRQYVTDKSLPLAERFDVWSKWCKKEEHGWIINEDQAGLFGKVVDDGSLSFDRYREYDWEYFLTRFKDNYSKLQERHGVTLDDVKEALIETNFGSFMMDW